MDDRRFDGITRALAGPGNRRRFLKGALGALLGTVAATGSATAATKTNPNNADKTGPDKSSGCDSVCKDPSATKASRQKCGCTGATTTTPAPTCQTASAMTCTTNSDCSTKLEGGVCDTSGWVWYGGVCVCPSGTKPNQYNTACVATTNSGTGAQVCELPVNCASDAVQYCGSQNIGGYDVPAICEKDASNNTVCAAYSLGKGCASNAECAAGEACVNGGFGYSYFYCMPLYAAPTTTTTTTLPPCGQKPAYYNDTDCNANYPGSVYRSQMSGCACPLGYVWNSTGTACTSVGASIGAAVCTTNVCGARSPQICGEYSTAYGSVPSWCTLDYIENYACVNYFPSSYTNCPNGTECTGAEICVLDPQDPTYTTCMYSDTDG